MNAFKKTPADVIGKLHPLFKGLSWAAMARSHDEERYALCHVLIERDGMITRCIATDGRRLHLHEFDAGLFDTDIETEIPDAGLYEIIAKSKKFIVIALSEVDTKYPDWRKIIPDFVPKQAAAVSEKNFNLICARTGIVIAADFLKDACGFSYSDHMNVCIEYGSESPISPFIIQHNLGKAIVMPIILENESDDADDEIAATPSFEGFALEKSEAKAEESGDAVKDDLELIDAPPTGR